MPRFYQSRDPRRRLNPMRQIPLYRSIESVFGASPAKRARHELTAATEALEQLQAAFACDRAALGEANRRPMTTRRWWQGQALRTINHRRTAIRAARRRLSAAQAAVAALTPADEFATSWLAEQAGVVVPPPSVAMQQVSSVIASAIVPAAPATSASS